MSLYEDYLATRDGNSLGRQLNSIPSNGVQYIADSHNPMMSQFANNIAQQGADYASQGYNDGALMFQDGHGYEPKGVGHEWAKAVDEELLNPIGADNFIRGFASNYANMLNGAVYDAYDRVPKSYDEWLANRYAQDEDM